MLSEGHRNTPWKVWQAYPSLSDHQEIDALKIVSSLGWGFRWRKSNRIHTKDFVLVPSLSKYKVVSNKQPCQHSKDYDLLRQARAAEKEVHFLKLEFTCKLDHLAESRSGEEFMAWCWGYSVHKIERLLTHVKEGKYYLEDPTGTVELDLSNCIFHILQIVSGGKHNLLVPTCLPADMKICSTSQRY